MKSHIRTGTQPLRDNDPVRCVVPQLSLFLLDATFRSVYKVRDSSCILQNKYKHGLKIGTVSPHISASEQIKPMFMHIHELGNGAKPCLINKE